MKKSLVTATIPDKIMNAMNELGIHVSIGDLYISNRGDYFHITGFDVQEYKHKPGTYDYTVKYKYLNNGWGSSSMRLCELKDDRKIDMLPGQSYEDIIKELEVDALSALADPSKLEIESDKLDSNTSIIPVAGKDTYVQIAAILEERKRRVEILGIIAHEKLNKLNSVASDLANKLGKIQKVIGVLELYLGIHEDVVQIQSGKNANTDEPISIRQLVLYLDEETGIYENGGIDFSKVEMFDEWIVADRAHLDLFLPEKKGMVACKPSRQRRDYGDSYVNAHARAANSMMYLIIRNGDNVYRIWTDIGIGDTFYPTTKELKQIEELFQKAEKSGSHYDEEHLQDAQMLYIRNALMMQGIIDRTELLQPLPGGHINMMDPKTYEDGGHVRMIRDAEYMLLDGKIAYDSWKKNLNAKIKRGSRVLYVHQYLDKDSAHYYFVHYTHWYPEAPKTGVYTVDEVITGKRYRNDGARFLYMPNEYTSYWGNERKNRVSFVQPVSDWNILNYDGISLDDVEYYIHSRIEREKYLNILPTLMNIKTMRLQEIEDEKGFVTLLAHKLGCKEKVVWKYVNWWKYKNIWKRPIRQDDAKAWRMITSKVKKAI